MTSLFRAKKREDEVCFPKEVVLPFGVSCCTWILLYLDTVILGYCYTCSFLLYLDPEERTVTQSIESKEKREDEVVV